MVDSGPFQKLSLGCRVMILNTMLAVLIRKDLLARSWLCSWGVIEAN